MTRTRRPRAEGGRPHTTTVSFSESEWAAIEAAAARAAMAPGAWVGDSAARAAELPEPVVPGARVSAGAAGSRMQELMEDRRVLRNIGGNLNDIARVANTDGALESTVGQVAQMVARAVERIDRTVTEVDQQVTEAMPQARRSRSRR